MSLEPAEKKYMGRFDLDDLAYVQKNWPKMTCISLFSGAGGAALGISQAGFEVRAFVEWEKAACDTLRLNWTREGVAKHKHIAPYGSQWWHQEREPAIIQGDIRKISAEEILKAADLRIGECTLLEGGFPCQGFSFANSARDGADHTKDERNTLYLELIRVVRGTLPKTIMLENVKGLIYMEKGKVLRMICNDIAQSGYNVSWQLLDAADYGVPQHRERIFIMAERNDMLRYTGDVPQLHIAGHIGTITHPDWFLKKFPEKTQLSLFDKLK